ncbi:C40 family peptidase, partial [Streptomyces lydicus]
KAPPQFFDRSHHNERLTSRQQQAVSDYQEQAAAAARQRAEAGRSLERLQTSQASLKASKQSVQQKLAEARQLLSRLTAQEKARLAELERQKEAAAKRKAEEEARRQQERERQRQQDGGGTAGGGTAGGGTGGGGTTGGTQSTKAEQALAFARAQIGKPYVWGATGPSSYDCSGLTQAAWKAAGVDLPRTTWDQVKVGQRVATSNLQPGDLVFFFDDISHVGMYIGGGKMIHAPHPGANVREESIYYMPIYGSVRPG